MRILPGLMLVAAAALAGAAVAAATALPSPTPRTTAALERLEPPPPTTTTTTAATTTTTTVAAAPRPAVVEDDPIPVRFTRPMEPIVVIGQIEIPKLGLAAPLHEGISLRVIDQGPSHWPGTAMPGQRGNVVIAGHRVTHSRPFRHIDALVPGDQVIFTVASGRWVYEVAGHEIVTPQGLHILDQTAEPTATLFACHPPGSARYRYVVHLRLAPDAA